MRRTPLPAGAGAGAGRERGAGRGARHGRAAAVRAPPPARAPHAQGHAAAARRAQRYVPQIPRGRFLGS